MSADTGMGEVVLTARKGSQGRSGIVYACIHEPFKTAAEAAETARALRHGLTGGGHISGQSGVISLGGDHVGDWYWSPNGEGIWAGAGMSQLSRFFSRAEAIIGGMLNLVNFPIAKVGDIFEVGPTHHLIGHPVVKGKSQEATDPIGAFTLYPYDREKSTSDLILWKADSKTQTQITLQATHYGSVRNSKSKDADIRRREKTNLFIQRNMGWKSQKILVAHTNQPIMGGRAWAGLRHEDEDVKFAFAIWANSIFGFVSHWAQAGRQHQGRSLIQINGIRKLRCPDFTNPELKERASQFR